MLRSGKPVDLPLQRFGVGPVPPEELLFWLAKARRLDRSSRVLGKKCRLHPPRLTKPYERPLRGDHRIRFFQWQLNRTLTLPISSASCTRIQMPCPHPCAKPSRRRVMSRFSTSCTSTPDLCWIPTPTSTSASICGRD